MAVGQSFITADRGLYLAVQSAKGTAATTFKAAAGFTRFDYEPVKGLTKGVPMLGLGNWLNRSIGHDFSVKNGTAEGWMSLDYLLGFMMELLGAKTTTGSVAPFTHSFAWYQKNSTMKYATIYVVDGETATGTGITTEMIRDVKISNMKFNINGNDAVKFSFNFEGLNMGAGAATPTLDTTGLVTPSIPNPVDSINNTFTWPSWFPTSNTICNTSIDITWAGNLIEGPACIGTGEHADLYIDQQSWELGFKFLYTSDFVKVRNQILAGADTLSADTTGLKPALKEGAFSYLLSSQDIAGGSTLKSIAQSFPKLQWTVTKVNNASPTDMDVTASSFGGDSTATVINAVSGTNFAF